MDHTVQTSVPSAVLDFAPIDCVLGQIAFHSSTLTFIKLIDQNSSYSYSFAIVI